MWSDDECVRVESPLRPTQGHASEKKTSSTKYPFGHSGNDRWEHTVHTCLRSRSGVHRERERERKRERGKREKASSYVPSIQIQRTKEKVSE